MTGVVVVGTDGSETANIAVVTAAQLAVDLRAVLHVVAVYEPGHGSEMAPLIARGGRTPELLDAVRSYQTCHGEEPEFHLLQGDPAEQVIAVATELGATLVVIGSLGMGGMKDSLRGSVPTKIARGAPCDVYIVRTA